MSEDIEEYRREIVDMADNQFDSLGLDKAERESLIKYCVKPNVYNVPLAGAGAWMGSTAPAVGTLIGGVAGYLGGSLSCMLLNPGWRAMRTKIKREFSDASDLIRNNPAAHQSFRLATKRIIAAVDGKSLACGASGA